MSFLRSILTAPELDFASDQSYIEWELRQSFNDSLDAYSFSVMALFRTRTDDGMIFTAASHSRLEHIKVDVSACALYPYMCTMLNFQNEKKALTVCMLVASVRHVANM